MNTQSQNPHYDSFSLQHVTLINNTQAANQPKLYTAPNSYSHPPSPFPDRDRSMITNLNFEGLYFTFTHSRRRATHHISLSLSSKLISTSCYLTLSISLEIPPYFLLDVLDHSTMGILRISERRFALWAARRRQGIDADADADAIGRVQDAAELGLKRPRESLHYPISSVAIGVANRYIYIGALVL
jgi:hypothetical protein